MIFSETACGLTLPSDKKRLPTLPCSSRFAMSVFLVLSLFFPCHFGCDGYKKSRPLPDSSLMLQ